MKELDPMFFLVAGGFFGLVYVALLIVEIVVLVAVRPFVVGVWSLAALLIPIGLYLYLEWGIHHRQDFYMMYANLVIVVPAGIACFLATRSPTAYWVMIVVSTATAFASWLLVPRSPGLKLF